MKIRTYNRMAETETKVTLRLLPSKLSANLDVPIKHPAEVEVEVSLQLSPSVKPPSAICLANLNIPTPNL